MALTPEDVVNKRFQPTKFREGYDQDEVDDFLDEVVVELRRLGHENEELRQRLIAAEASANSAQQNTMQQVAPAAQQPQAQAPSVVPAAYPAGTDPNSDPNNTNNLLQLARRLHEEHVREGIEKRDSLIAEGHATAARIVSEAETQQRAHLSSLDQERIAIEQRIAELHSFEREYRQKLKGHIEGLLHDLDTTGSDSGGVPAPVGYDAAPAQPPASFQGFGGN